MQLCINFPAEYNLHHRESYLQHENKRDNTAGQVTLTYNSSNILIQYLQINRSKPAVT